jgi:hypothetical protein
MIRIKNKMFTAKDAEERKEGKYFIAGWFLSRVARDKKGKNLCALCALCGEISSSHMTPPAPKAPGKKIELN